MEEPDQDQWLDGVIKMDISIIGLGYIGFPTALLLARSGHRVLGVDINKNVVLNLITKQNERKESYTTEINELRNKLKKAQEALEV